LGLKFANNFYTGACKYLFFVRGIWKFAGQVLPGEMQILVHIEAPLGTIGHIVDNASMSNEFT
jgi:hypothetical protein